MTGQYNINPNLPTAVVGKVQVNYLPKGEGRKGWRAKKKIVHSVPLGDKQAFPCPIDRLLRLRNTTCIVFWRCFVFVSVQVCTILYDLVGLGLIFQYFIRPLTKENTNCTSSILLSGMCILKGYDALIASNKCMWPCVLNC